MNIDIELEKLEYKINKYNSLNVNLNNKEYEKLKKKYLNKINIKLKNLNNLILNGGTEKLNPVYVNKLLLTLYQNYLKQNNLINLLNSKVVKLSLNTMYLNKL